MNNQTQERLVVAMATHWIKYVPKGAFCTTIGLSGLLVLLGSYAAMQVSAELALGLAVVGGAIFLLAHHRWFHKVMSEEFIDIILTNERIIYFDDSLFFSDNEHEVPLHRVAGVEVKQEGLVRNMLNYGTIWIDTGGGTIDLRRSIPNVSHPEKLSELIAQYAHSDMNHSS